MKGTKGISTEESDESKPSEEIKEEPEEKEIPEKDFQEEIDSLKKQLADEKDRYLRLAAEFDNFRKRAIREQEEFRKYANEKLILDLIDVWESLERGIENSKNTDNKDKLITGMELVYKQFRDVLEKNGLVPIKSVGEKFDPYKHEAMMQTETDGCEDDIVLEEFVRGYMLNNRVIRYSKVRVSKKKEPDNKQEEDEVK